MRMKRFVSVLAAAVMVFGVTGCNAITIDGETENVSGEAAGNGSIGFSVSTLNNPFFVTLSEGAKEKAKTEGRDVKVARGTFLLDWSLRFGIGYCLFHLSV